MAHVLRVGHFVHLVIAELLKRAEQHDASKLREPELKYFRLASNLRNLTYGSPEYKEQLKQTLGPALEHHYARNPHHPEHHENGVDDMTLIDLLEMFCDWRAATERHGDGDIMQSIEKNEERFGLSPQLKQILVNTAKELEKLNE